MPRPPAIVGRLAKSNTKVRKSAKKKLAVLNIDRLNEISKQNQTVKEMMEE